MLECEYDQRVRMGGWSDSEKVASGESVGIPPIATVYYGSKVGLTVP